MKKTQDGKDFPLALSLFTLLTLDKVCQHHKDDNNRLYNQKLAHDAWISMGKDDFFENRFHNVLLCGFIFLIFLIFLIHSIS
jgi:hypothetical protein